MREYEQLGKDASTRTLADPRTEINRDEAALVAKINELEEELAIMKEGPFGPNSALVQAVPDEYRAQVLRELEEAGLLKLVEEDITEDPDLENLFDEESNAEGESSSVRKPAVTADL